MSIMSPARIPFAASAIAAGLVAGYAVPSRTLALAVLAVGVAAANGYSKAYSP